MKFLRGVISDKLHKMFTPEQILHNPHPGRSMSPPKPGKVPKGVEGQSLKGRNK